MLNHIVKITDDEFLQLRDIIYKKSFIAFSESKKYLLENRLSRRMNDLNFSTFKDYIYYLKYDADGSNEMNHMINLVTINETYFFRECSQMDHLVDVTLPGLIHGGRTNIRIWSAACSTGEEPYSIAMLINEAGLYSKANISIVATDINSTAIDSANRGAYRSLSFRGMHEHLSEKYFIKDKMMLNIIPEIKDKVHFEVANLAGDLTNTPFGDKFDIIFCRNALIYFDIEGKRKVLSTFYDCLSNPGYLYLGYSENIVKITSSYTTINFGTGLVQLKTT